MNVYQTDLDGVFISVAIADPDPMDASHMLIPAGCVETAPPSTTDTQLARWDGAAWFVENIPQPETGSDQTPEELAESARNKRNFLLSATDWWATSDRTMTAAQTAYRQALRDIPDQPDFPANITWPNKPA